MEKTISHKGFRIPSRVAWFFAKAVLLFALWKLIYVFWLQPARLVDEPLTHAVGVTTTRMLNVFAHQPFRVTRAYDQVELDGGVIRGYVMDIGRGQQQILRIADACNGLEMMVLYMGFLICFPATLRRKLSYLFPGLALLFVLNIFRCMALVWIDLHYPQYLDFSHHFVFTFLVYAVIFLLWYRFTKNQLHAGGVKAR